MAKLQGQIVDWLFLLTTLLAPAGGCKPNQGELQKAVPARPLYLRPLHSAACDLMQWLGCSEVFSLQVLANSCWLTLQQSKLRHRV